MAGENIMIEPLDYDWELGTKVYSGGINELADKINELVTAVNNMENNMARLLDRIATLERVEELDKRLDKLNGQEYRAVHAERERIEKSLKQLLGYWPDSHMGSLEVKLIPSHEAIQVVRDE